MRETERSVLVGGLFGSQVHEVLVELDGVIHDGVVEFLALFRARLRRIVVVC